MRSETTVPAWLTGNTGIIETVPRPWTPVTAQQDTLSCWGRAYAFDGGPFPARIVSRTENLLARPMALRADIRGQAVSWTACAVKPVERQKCGRFVKRIAVARAADVLLTSEATLFYDGAMRLDVRLDPLKPLTVDALTLSMPVRRGQASLILAILGASPDTTPRAFSPDAIPESGLAGPFSPVVWLGTEERGLTWFCESDEGWDPGEGALALNADRRTVTVSLRIVRAARALDAPFRFSFGLLANPWRPAEKGCERFRNYHYHSMFNLSEEDLRALYGKGYRTVIFHAYLLVSPEAEYGKQLAALVRRCHRVGLKLLIYFGSEMSTGQPEWPAWGRRWILREPVRGYSFRGHIVTHVCSCSEWPEFILHGVAWLMRTYDVDGVYLDGWSEWGDRCVNSLHGCGRTLADGSRHATLHIWKCRELMERVYATVKSIKPRGRISIHASPGLGIGAHFSTDCFAGEGYHGNFRKVEPAHVRAVHMGLEQWGVFSELIASADYAYGQAIGLLHGVLPRAGAYELSHAVVVEEPACVWKVQDAFGVTTARWHPYWRTGAWVRAEPDSVKVSLWSHPGRGALLVLSNLSLGTETADAVITITPAKLGFKGRLETLDMLPCAHAAAWQGGRLRASVPAGQCRLIVVAPPASTLWPRLRRAREWVAERMRQQAAHTRLDPWLLAGPFGADTPPAGAGDVPPGFRGLETAYPPESLPVNTRASFDVAGGKPGAWLRAVAKNGALAMRPEVVRESWDVVYAYTRILFPTLVPSVPDNPVELHLAAHNAFKVWVNGQEVYAYGGAGAPRYGQKRLTGNAHAIRAILHPGWNPVLIKLVIRAGNGKDSTAMTFSITGPGGETIPPLLLKAEDGSAHEEHRSGIQDVARNTRRRNPCNGMR